MQNQHEEEQLGKLYDRQVAKRLLSYLSPYKKYVATAIPLITITSVIELIGLNITMVAVDLYLKPTSESELSTVSKFAKATINYFGWKPAISEVLAGFAAAYILVILTGFIFSYLQTVILSTMGQYIMYDMRKQIFAHLQKLPLQFYDKNPVGRLITRLTSDVDALNELMTSGFVTLFSDLFTLLGIMFFLFLVNWKLAIVLVTILPLMILVTAWFRKNATKGFREVRVKLARINSFLQEHITGMAIVQIFNREERAMAEFSDINDQHRVVNIKTIFYYAVFYPAIGFVNALGTSLIIWFGGEQVISGVLTLGALIFFIQSTQRFYEPIQDISEKYNILQSAMAAAERVFRLLDTEVTIKSIENPKKIKEFRGEVEFANVWFAYNGEDWVLKDVSFKIEPGQSVAFVGHTGAGKTTISSLLLRMYDIQKGKILLDGIDIRELDLAELRKTFGVVLQDVFLFSGDILTNINLGDESIKESQVRAAAKEVHADDFIMKLEGGYNAELTERGSTLSTGQRQLLSFARALAFDPRILVLDEATSSVDTETELLIQDAIAKLLKGRTSLIIAHRLSTIQSADKIIVLHKGQVREAGSHQQLLAKRGIYYKLYKLQYKEKEEVVKQ
ncbi:MAG: ABC transporter ATP-binding protein [Blastocatellia bacterium]|nr:ABC transporter ATP-binding protein [Blastocatellia bacterium]